MDHPDVTALDRKLAQPMFWLAAAFLVFTAGLLHVHGDADGPEDETAVGSVQEATLAPELPDLGTAGTVARWCGWALLMIYPVFVIEGLLQLRQKNRTLRQHVWFALLPPLRLVARDHVTGANVWLPRIGWAEVNDELRQRVERGASIPMLAVALMVLPLFAADHFLSKQIQQSTWLVFLLRAGQGLVWMAFAAEFIVGMSLAEKRFRYAKEHWLDLLIICLPLIAFLRALRLTRLMRLGRLGRLQQLAKTTRVFRLRGTLMRLWRAILLLEVVDRVLRAKPEKRIAKLREECAERERELTEMKAEIARLEAQLLAQEAVSESEAV